MDDMEREHGDGAQAGESGEAPIEVGDATMMARHQLRDRLDGIVESLLFASGVPVSLRRLTEILNGPPAAEVKAAVARLMEEYHGDGRGIRLLAVAGGYQFRTAPENGEWVRALLRERPARVGRAALETLAIVAYKQPVTRAEIEFIRGVDAESPLSTLLARRLIKIAGRKEAVGRPLVYATTADFLEAFGLRDLGELPALREIGPVAEEENEEEACAENGFGRAPAEDLEPGGDQLAASGGGSDPDGAGEGEPPGGDGAGHEGEPGPRPDHGG